MQKQKTKQQRFSSHFSPKVSGESNENITSFGSHYVTLFNLFLIYLKMYMCLCLCVLINSHLFCTGIKREVLTITLQVLRENYRKSLKVFRMPYENIKHVSILHWRCDTRNKTQHNAIAFYAGQPYSNTKMPCMLFPLLLPRFS